MANPKIEVEIGASTNGLIKGVDGAILSMKQLKDQAKTIEDALEKSFDPDEIGNYNSQLSKLKAGMTALKSQGVDQLTKATSNYNGVGVEFSRIIQDAPFGIIGVGNNITRLAETFQNLRSQSSSTGAAIKTALTSIISPANLLVLGISAVTTAFTLYQMGAFESSDSTKSLADAAKAAKDEMEEFRLSLDAVTQSRIKGEGNAQKEIGDLKLLKNQAESTTVSMKNRLEAVDELQKKSPEYFGNLTQEQILTGNVGNSYGELTKQIIATAKARAFSEKIGENAEKLFLLEEQSLQKTGEILKLREKQEGLEKNTSRIDRRGFGASAVTGADLLSLNNQSKINDLVQEQIGLVSQRNQINAENLKLENETLKTFGEGAKVTKSTITTKSKLKEQTNEVYDFELKRFDNLKKIDALFAADQARKEKNQKLDATDFGSGFVPTQETVDEAPLGLIPDIQNQIRFLNVLKNAATDTGAIKEYNIEIGQLQKRLEEINGTNESISEFGTIVGQVFQGLGNQIANSLNISNDALKGFVGTLLSNTPKIIAAIFQQAAANKAAAAKSLAASKSEAIGDAIVTGGKAAKALGPVGLALLPVFIGGAVALISKAFGGGGGSSGGGGSVGSSVSSQTFSGGGVGGLGGGNRELSGELVVRGNDLVYVLGQSNNKIAKG